MTLAWHFTGPTLRDGRPIPPVGEWLVHDGAVKMCESGLHASIDVWDSLRYAPGNMLHRVECEDIGHIDTDKLVCRRRKIIASHDAESLLRRFACDCALKVLPDTAPDIVRRYLVSCDDTIRDAAWSAARDAARSAARPAAWDAAWSAAWDAAWSAARDAAWSAAGDTAWDAAWSAARDAAQQKMANDCRLRIYAIFNESQRGEG